MKAIEYCKINNYEKIKNNIQFPLQSNLLEDNVSKYDGDFIAPIKDDFPSLLALFKLAKILEIEPLYQLCAAAQASFFRRRCLEDVRRDLNL